MVSIGETFFWEGAARIESRLRSLQDDLEVLVIRASQARWLDDSVLLEQRLEYLLDYLNAIVGDVEGIQELLARGGLLEEDEDVGDDYQPPLLTYPAPQKVTMVPYDSDATPGYH